MPILYTGKLDGISPDCQLTDVLVHVRTTPPDAVDDSGDTTITSTAKLFINDQKTTLAELDLLLERVPKNARLIVSLGLDFSEESELSLDALETIKRIAEVSTEHISGLGVENMAAVRLQAVARHLKPKYKLAIDQIDAEECCALPPDIMRTAKELGVELLAHHDKRVILGPAELAVLEKASGQTIQQWHALLRVVSIHNGRQVVAHREYDVLVS